MQGHRREKSWPCPGCAFQYEDATDPNLGRLQARRGQARADLLGDRLDEATNLMPRSARDKVSIDDDVVKRRGVDGPSIHDIGKDDLVADDLAPGQVFGTRCQQPQSMAQGALDDTWILHCLREEFYGWRGAGHLRTDRHPSGGLEVTKSNARVTGGHDDCGIVVEVHRLEIDRDIQQLQPLPRLFEVHFQLVDGTDECQLLLSPEIGHEVDLGSPIRKALPIRVDLAGNEHVLNEDSDLPTLKASLADHRLSVPGSRSRFEDWMPVSRFLDKWSVNPTAVVPSRRIEPATRRIPRAVTSPSRSPERSFP